MTEKYSTDVITDQLIDELKSALKSITPYGSMEVYVQNGMVTQITVRKIKKTNSNGNGKAKFISG